MKKARRKNPQHIAADSMSRDSAPALDESTKHGVKSAEEYHLRTIIEAEPECVKLLAADCTLLEMNPAGLSMIEADSMDQVLGRSVLGLISEECRTEFQRLTSQTFQGNRGVLEFKIRGLKGTPRWLETHAVPLKNKAGEVFACLGITRDITEQKNAESQRDQALECLRASEEKFEKAFRASPVAITLSTLAEGRYLDVNNAFLEILEYERKDVIGKTSGELNVWVESYERDEMLRQLAHSGRISEMRTRFRTSTGDIRQIELSADLIELDGAPCVLAISNDVTARLQLEKQFLQAQRMEAVGRLAAGVAHDFNNVLGVILGYSQIAEEMLGVAHPTTRHLLQIKKAAQRAATLTRQLLVFSRQQPLYPRVLDLNVLMGGMSQMLAAMVGEDVKIELKPQVGLGSIKADAGQVEQILMNLIVNARDAMPEGGKITIETRNAVLDLAYSKLHGSLPEGPYVLLSVADEGCGMDAGTLARIFEPFFTTKDPGRGTGLGLSTVHGIVQQSNGHIFVYSERGKGTTFKIYFPLVGEKPDAPVKTCSDDLAGGGSETILLVEDDDALREVTIQLLQRAGYCVLAAENGKTGLVIAEQHHDEIDLLLTDVIMPDMSGGELSSRVLKIAPGVRVLFASGYKGALVVKHGGLPKEAITIEKPYTKNCLLAKVREILDRDH